MPEQRPSRFIQRDADLAELLPALSAEPALAVDTESNSFHAYFERVCLIQLSTRDADFVIDPFQVDVKALLGPLFADPKVEMVLHAADYDVRSLKRDFGFRFGRLFDTMLAAKLVGCPALGLAALVRARFGVALAKQHQCSDWGRRPLSVDQLAYAHMDTRYLLPLRDQLAAEIARLGKGAQARRLFSRQAACVPRPKRFDPEGFLRIRGYRGLEEGARALARALYLLREDRARAANRPPFKIYGDDALLELCRCQPRTCDALAKVKGLGSSTVRRDGEAIVQAIAQALPPQIGPGEAPAP